MAYQDLALPVDIPWKRLVASSDMMDKKYGDQQFPPKWKSSITIFWHEPSDLPDTYCDRKVTYLKIVCSITGYQAGNETGLNLPSGSEIDSATTTLGEKYRPCYGALLQIAVFPNTKDGSTVPLADYPYVVDFEPKRRELYEAVTQSGEILGRSASTLNLRKSSTSGETTEVSSKIGAEVKGGIPVISGKAYAEHNWGGGTHIEEENVRTTDESREKRETYSSTTSITQMYELFTGYHLGSNRALFFIVSRPHTTEQKDKYTFVNGPRRLEGIQEVFLIINRPKSQPGICIESYLETAHLDVDSSEATPNAGTPQPNTYSYLASTPVTMFGLWEDNRGPVGNTKDYEQLVFQLPPNCELDTTRPNPPQSFEVQEFNRLPKLTINVPPGLQFDIQNDTFWRSIQSITATVTAGQVIATVTLRNGGGNWAPRFHAMVTVYYKCPQASPQHTGQSPQSNTEKTLYLTARGLSTCVALNGNEISRPSNVDQPVDWEKLLDPQSQKTLLDWLGNNRIINIGAVPLDEYRQKLQELYEGDKRQFDFKLREAIDGGGADPIPDQWLKPVEWVSFEKPISIAPILSDPAAPAVQRIRAANDLNMLIGRQMIESLGSSRRYANRTVDFWHSNVALSELTNAVNALPDTHPSNLRVADINISYKDELLNNLGQDLRLKQLIALDVSTLRKGLGLTEVQARQLKLDFLSSFGRPPAAPNDEPAKAAAPDNPQ